MDELDKLGNRRTKLLAELNDVTSRLHDEIRAARKAGVTQSELMTRSGYKTIQQIRTITGEDKNSKRPKVTDD